MESSMKFPFIRFSLFRVIFNFARSKRRLAEAPIVWACSNFALASSAHLLTSFSILFVQFPCILGSLIEFVLLFQMANFEEEKHQQRTNKEQPNYEKNSRFSYAEMSSNETAHENVRKRKYMPLAFNKSAVSATSTVQESTRSSTFTPMSFKRSKLEDDGENDEDYNDLPSFRPIGFTPAAPVLFAKASEETKDGEDEEEEEQGQEESAPKLSTSQISQLENSVRTRNNVFKGRKYGIGAALLKKMGYVDGQGLGKEGQGIVEPIQQDLRKVGVGIGGGAITEKSGKRKKQANVQSEEDSSDEEYYRDVPKKSLFQIILEIEENGVVLPDRIKHINDENSRDSHKSFIELKKEGNKDLEELTQKLDNLNKELSELISTQRLKEYELLRLEKGLKEAVLKEDLYKELTGIFANFNDILETDSTPLEKLGFVIEEFKGLKVDQFDKLPDFDIDRTIITIIKPLISELFESWDPLEITETSLLEILVLLKESIPEPKEIYGELSYFQSLLYSFWYPKTKAAFENWSIEQPNVGITLLLDWSEVIDESVIEFFTVSVITPKIIEAIKKWNIGERLENPPYVWIFEWIPYVKNSMYEIVEEFKKKYKEWFDNWTFNSGKVEGIHSLREIIGDEEFHELINKELVPNLVSFYLDFEISLDLKGESLPVGVLFRWSDVIDHDVFDNLIKFSFFNCWNRSLYYSLGRSRDFNTIADNVDIAFRLLSPYAKDFKSVEEQFSEGLDVINKLVDENKIEKKYSSLTKSKVLELVFQQQKNPTVDNNLKSKGTPLHKLQVTFKEVVEDYCIQNNLFFKSLKGDLSSGHLFFKISKDPKGKTGLVSYIEEDVLWVKENDSTFSPISLDSVINRI